MGMAGIVFSPVGMENECIDKALGSPVFWTLMGVQALGTGGFIVLAVMMDIKYMDAPDSPGMASIAIGIVLGLPVACFCFLFAGAAFFNAFTKFSLRRLPIPPLQPINDNISISPLSMP